MVNQHDGGPAFPRLPVIQGSGYVVDEGADGMSLRDYFAGEAAKGILSGEIPHSPAVASNVLRTQRAETPGVHRVLLNGNDTGWRISREGEARWWRLTDTAGVLHDTGPSLKAVRVAARRRFGAD